MSKTVANLIPIEKNNDRRNGIYFLLIRKYRDKTAKKIIGKSLCDETRPSIIIKGLKTNKVSPNNSFLGEIFLRIFAVKQAVPKKLKELRNLNKKNVGRKKLNPIKDKGAVNTSQAGPYG